jgi:Tfp pilus assembly protein PilN
MTVRINFLPRNYQPPRPMGARGWLAVGAAVVTLASAGAYYGSVYTGTLRLEAQALRDRRDLQVVQGKLAEAAAIRTREERVALAEQELKALAGRHWSGVLLILSQLTPEHVTWISLESKGDDLVLKGSSRGMVDLAQLMGGLVTDLTVDQVALRAVNEKGVPVTLVVRPPSPEHPDGGTDRLSEAMKELAKLRQLEFELVITLKAAGGGAVQRGA